MSSTLILLAAVCAANPFRVAACAPAAAAARRAAAAVATLLSLAATALLALLGETILQWLDVSGSSSRIAAGVAVLVVGIRDLFIQPPQPEPALQGWRAGLVPMAFPAFFSPALAMLTLSAGSARGPGTAFVLIGAATVAVGVMVAAGLRATYWRAAAVGSAAAVVGTLLTLSGITAI